MMTDSFSEEIKRLAAELRRIEQRLREEPPPDQTTLNEFRQSVDNVRLTAWSVSELINAERVKKDPNTVLAFLSAERLRRFDQLVRNLCSDIERQALTLETNGMQTLKQSVNMLQQKLVQPSGEERHDAFKAKNVASQ
jgi:Mg2+ and Co2+ transporter CorA